MGEGNQRRSHINGKKQSGSKFYVELRALLMEENQMIWGTIVYIVYAAILIGMGAAVLSEIHESEE